MFIFASSAHRSGRKEQIKLTNRCILASSGIYRKYSKPIIAALCLWVKKLANEDARGSDVMDAHCLFKANVGLENAKEIRLTKMRKKLLLELFIDVIIS
jgi:hypothetical protein